MKTISYANIHDQKGNRRTLAVTNHTFNRVVEMCKGNFAFSGQDKSHYIVAVSEWQVCLKIVNEHIRAGFLICKEVAGEIKFK